MPLSQTLTLSPYPVEYDNSSVGEEEHFEWRHVREALSDWQVWLLSFINMTVLTAGACLD